MCKIATWTDEISFWTIKNSSDKNLRFGKAKNVAPIQVRLIFQNETVTEAHFFFIESDVVDLCWYFMHMSKINWRKKIEDWRNKFTIQRQLTKKCFWCHYFLFVKKRCFKLKTSPDCDHKRSEIKCMIHNNEVVFCKFYCWVGIKPVFFHKLH